MNVEYLKAQMEQSKLYANWWLTSAQTGHALQRKLFHGSTSELGGISFTDKEKIDDAMNISKRHIKKFMELAETLLELDK